MCRLPWPCMREGRRLFVLGGTQGGRGQTLGRFLGAAFVGFGLLLLLVGQQQGLPPALAGGGACIVAGLGLLAVVRTGRAALAILDGERGWAVLCRRRLGSRAFRVFPLATLEVTADAAGRAVLLRPARDGEAGDEIPGLPSRISDREWRQGMMLPAAPGDAVEAVAELDRWLRLARVGEPPEPEEASEAAEFATLLGKPLAPALKQWLTGASEQRFPASQDAESERDMPGRSLRVPTPPHPEIRRAPDLRDASGNRDKRD